MDSRYRRERNKKQAERIYALGLSVAKICVSISSFDEFNATAVEHCKICEIDGRAMVKVKAVAPVRRSAIGLQPVRCKNAKVIETVSDYPDCVCAVKFLAGGK
jgi:hypothetical protein